MPRTDSPARTRSSAHASRPLLLERVESDLLGERGGHDHDAIGVADDHVARHHQRAAAGNRNVRVGRVVDASQGAPGADLVVHGHLQRRDGCAVAQTAVGHDPGSAASQRAGRQDVADRAGARLPAGVDDEHLIGADRLDRALLRVQLGTVAVAHVLAERHVAQRVGVAEQPQVRPS